MSQKFLVRGPDRREWAYHWVAGRGWGKDPVEIEVVDGDDPTVNEKIEGQEVVHPDMHRLSRTAFEEVRADRQMNVQAIDAAGEAELKIDVAALVAEDAKLKTEIAGLRDTVKVLNKRIEELNKELDEATKPQGVPVLARRKKE